jgi:CBS domain-containing protein
MKVHDIMTRPLQTCTLHDNLATVAMRMWESDCGALPVKNHEGRVVGMITDRDICMAAATKHHEISDVLVWETITGDLVVCHPEDEITTALHAMATRQVRRLPVIDEQGMLEGILSMNDIILNADHKIAEHDVLSALKAICQHRRLVGI